MKLFPTRWYPDRPSPPIAEQVVDIEHVRQSTWSRIAEVAWARGCYLASCIAFRHLNKTIPDRTFTIPLWMKILGFGVIYASVLGFAIQPEYVWPIVLWSVSFAVLFLVFSVVVSVHPMRQPPPAAPYPRNPVARATRWLFALLWYVWLGWTALMFAREIWRMFND